MNTIKRNALLDIIKVIASLLIIALHCRFFYDVDVYLYQITSNGLFFIALPLFFCINGYFLSLVFKKKSFRIWLSRIIILYLVWTLLYSFFWVKPFSISKTLQVILFGFNHLWYLASLIAGALLLYVTKNFKSLLLSISAVTLFLIGLIFQYLNLLDIFTESSIAHKLLSYPTFYRNFLFYTFPFLSIGLLIERTRLTQKLSSFKIIVLLIIGLVLLVLDSLINKVLFTHENVINMHLSYLLAAPILLIFALKNNVHLRLDSKILSNLSIAMYLAHPWIIYLFIINFNFSETLLTLLSTVTTFIFSLLLIKINNHLKFLL